MCVLTSFLSITSFHSILKILSHLEHYKWKHNLFLVFIFFNRMSSFWLKEKMMKIQTQVFKFISEFRFVQLCKFAYIWQIISHLYITTFDFRKLLIRKNRIKKCYDNIYFSNLLTWSFLILVKKCMLISKHGKMGWT